MPDLQSLKWIDEFDEGAPYVGTHAEKPIRPKNPAAQAATIPEDEILLTEELIEERVI